MKAECPTCHRILPVLTWKNALGKKVHSLAGRYMTCPEPCYSSWLTSSGRPLGERAKKIYGKVSLDTMIHKTPDLESKRIRHIEAVRRWQLKNKDRILESQREYKRFYRKTERGKAYMAEWAKRIKEDGRSRLWGRLHDKKRAETRKQERWGNSKWKELMQQEKKWAKEKRTPL